VGEGDHSGVSMGEGHVTWVGVVLFGVVEMEFVDAFVFRRRSWSNGGSFASFQKYW
jgi:hypothetical protein